MDMPSVGVMVARKVVVKWTPKKKERNEEAAGRRRGGEDMLESLAEVLWSGLLFLVLFFREAER